jgi:sigma-54 dependent transcriptional regulator, acetoin dehydrogenase operon transcriptional activator AcoR
LHGESGTGKEVLARALHAATGRGGPFVAVNCGALPAALVESQLFGHVKGAFSGALRDEAGFVRAAQGGTLLLDEIADLPLSSQATLLRVLQEREVVPVGATRPVAVDVRILAATHRRLEALVQRGEFREDLFARIAGCVLDIPPLRDRKDDLGVLVSSLLRRLAPAAAPAMTFTPDAGRALLAYGWPMNVRELERALATGVALAPDGAIGEAQLPPAVVAALHAPALADEGVTAAHLSERDRQLRLDLLEQLSQHRGNVTEVARAMGKPRTQVHRWCKRFAVDPGVFRR